MYTINTLYEKYSEIEILFNTEIQKYLFLEPQNVYLKIGDEQWNCYLYTCSMTNAKILVNLNPALFEKFQTYNNKVSLRLSFKPPDEKHSITFFINCIIKGYKNYSSEDKDTYIINLNFIQKPSDYLIQILGDIIYQNEKIEKRKDVRITLNNESLKILGMQSNNIICIIDNIKRQCLLRNISASGAVVLISGIPKYIMNKNITLVIKIKNKDLLIKGITNRYSNFLEKMILYEIGIEFDEDGVPTEFIKKLNDYLDKNS